MCFYVKFIKISYNYLMHQCANEISQAKNNLGAHEKLNDLIMKKKNPTKALKDIIKPFIESQNLSNTAYNFRQRKTKTFTDSNEDDSNKDSDENNSSDQKDLNGEVFLKKKKIRMKRKLKRKFSAIFKKSIFYIII